MDRYIGTKIVLAEPAQRDAITGKVLGPGDEATGPTLAGYKVVYEDGYTSWSPKEVFERCYRRITEAEIDLIENHTLKGAAARAVMPQLRTELTEAQKRALDP